MSLEEFNRTAAVVATNVQKLVQNVSSMQRMLVHVESQGEGLRQQLRQLQDYTGQRPGTQTPSSSSWLRVSLLGTVGPSYRGRGCRTSSPGSWTTSRRCRGRQRTGRAGHRGGEVSWPGGGNSRPGRVDRSAWQALGGVVNSKSSRAANICEYL